MKHKYVLLGLVLLLEALGIIWYSLTISKNDAKYIAAVIQVPENMVLTTDNDICFSVDREKEIIVPEGTRITPDYIFINSVSFSYDGYHHISAKYNDFVEQAKLDELKTIALQEKNNSQKEHVIRGVVIGICVSVCWVILGMAIAHVLIKKRAILFLIIVHFIVLLIISLMICGSHLYLSK